jgi:hypothetical protein
MARATLFPRFFPIAFLAAACSQPVTIEHPLSGMPVYDKFGGVSYCVGPDGDEYPANRGQRDPCERQNCPGGFLSAAGEYICPDRGDDPDDPGTPGGEPNDPGGPFGTSDPGSPPPPPPSPGVGGTGGVTGIAP